MIDVVFLNARKNEKTNCRSSWVLGYLMIMCEVQSPPCLELDLYGGYAEWFDSTRYSKEIRKYFKHYAISVQRVVTVDS